MSSKLGEEIQQLELMQKANPNPSLHNIIMRLKALDSSENSSLDNLEDCFRRVMVSLMDRNSMTYRIDLLAEGLSSNRYNLSSFNSLLLRLK